MLDNYFHETEQPQQENQDASTVQWTFITYYKRDRQQSPRMFQTVDEALRAIVEKLAQHALDHEYPMICLLRILPRDGID